MKIGIIDYGIGNIYSIKNMIEYLEYNCEILTDIDEFDDCSKIILPGVGSYDAALNKINNNLKNKIREFNREKKQILGICLGAQLLGESSEEGVMKGLNLLPIVSKNFKGKGNNANIGWREITCTFSNKYSQRFYHIHNYYMDLITNNSKDFQIEYAFNQEQKFITGVKYNNLIAVQYHPEKSNDFGKSFFKWFCEL